MMRQNEDGPPGSGGPSWPWQGRSDVRRPGLRCRPSAPPRPRQSRGRSLPPRRRGDPGFERHVPGVRPSVAAAGGRVGCPARC